MVLLVHRQKFSTLIAVCLAALINFGVAYAQLSPDSGAEDGLKPEQSTDSDLAEPSPKNLSLDQLFVELKQEPDAVKARRIEQKIWKSWTRSGSETIDMLMQWASIAVKKKDWASAFDLLDQVVVLAPQYAEGWNRRATVHFIRSNYGRSLHDIEQVLKLEARHFGALSGLGSLLQKLGKDRQALGMWNKVLELYPAHKNAQKSVERLEEKMSGHGI